MKSVVSVLCHSQKWLNLNHEGFLPSDLWDSVKSVTSERSDVQGIRKDFQRCFWKMFHLFSGTDITYQVYFFEHLFLIWCQIQWTVRCYIWLSTSNTNLDVDLGSDTPGTGIWTNNLLSKTTSRIERVKRPKKIENRWSFEIFSYLSQHEGEKIAVTINRLTNRSTEEIAAAKKRAEERQFTHWFWWKPQNCLEKSAARTRNGRLKLRSSRSWKKHRLTARGLPTGNSQFQVLRWDLSSPVHLCAQFCSPGLLPSCLFLLHLFSDYWKPSWKQKIYCLGATDTSLIVVLFYIRISKAVGLFPTCLHFVQAHFVF